MYLTDFRESTLKEVITQIETGLFKKVTGLEIQDFELLVSLEETAEYREYCELCDAVFGAGFDL